MKEIKIFERLSFLFAWYDLWIGFFWDSKKKWLYFFPIPCFGFIVKFKLPIPSITPTGVTSLIAQKYAQTEPYFAKYEQYTKRKLINTECPD